MNQRLDFQLVAKMLAKKKRSLPGFTGSSGLRVDRQVRQYSPGQLQAQVLTLQVQPGP
jgi:hypothetical protein